MKRLEFEVKYFFITWKIKEIGSSGVMFGIGSMIYEVRSTIYGIRCLIYGIGCLIYGIECSINGIECSINEVRSTFIGVVTIIRLDFSCFENDDWRFGGAILSLKVARRMASTNLGMVATERRNHPGLSATPPKEGNWWSNAAWGIVVKILFAALSKKIETESPTRSCGTRPKRNMKY